MRLALHFSDSFSLFWDPAMKFPSISPLLLPSLARNTSGAERQLAQLSGRVAENVTAQVRASEGLRNGATPALGATVIKRCFFFSVDSISTVSVKRMVSLERRLSISHFVQNYLTRPHGNLQVTRQNR